MGRWTDLSCLVLLGLAVSCLAARLPYTGVRPIAYNLYFRPTVAKGCAFQGETEITLNIENSTNEIVLHSRHLNIDYSSVSIEPLSTGQEVEINKIESENEDGRQESEADTYEGSENITASEGQGDERHTLRLRTGRLLQAGGQYKLKLSYNGTMHSWRSTGLYCRKYRAANETRYLVSTSFEPYYARSAFPCFDEPNYKANFTIRVTHPKDLVALSNMPSARVQPLEDEEDMVVTEFEPTPPMSTYLVAFFVGKYFSREGPSARDGHKLRVWAPSEEKLEMGDTALIFARRHYDYLLNYTELSDPVAKTDFLAIRHFMNGGLENWGLVTLEERMMLLDDKARSRKASLLRSSSLVAHELAHSWFGNLVTPAYWDDIWLSEGFSSYFASRAVAHMYPQYDYEVQAWVQARLSAMSADSFPTTHPLKVPVTDHPTGDLFDEITYHKGELIVRMVELTVGEEALRRGLRRYLSERRFASASETRLWELVEEEAGPGLLPDNVTLAEVMESWVTTPGYPVVTVRRDYASGEVTLSQRSVLESEGEAGGWWIPLSYTCEEERNFTARPRLWLSPYSGPVTVNISLPRDHWLLFNNRGAGYYAVRYDDRNGLLLADDLESLPLLERLQTFGDILELGRLGQSPVQLSLDLFLHFKVEASPEPWFIFLGLVPKYMGLLRGTSLEDQFTSMVQRILEPEVTKLTSDSPHRKQVMRLSCQVGVKNCTDIALQMYQQWKENKTKLPEDMQYTVLCTAVSKGGKETWEYLMTRYKQSECHRERKDILKALACTDNQELHNRYLGLATEKSKGKEGRDEPRKKGTMLKALAERNPDLVLTYLSNQLSSPSAKPHKCMKYKKVFEELAANVNNEKQLEMLRRLMEEDSRREKWGKEGRGNSNGILELASSNIEWLRRNQESAQEWFTKNKSLL